MERLLAQETAGGTKRSRGEAGLDEEEGGNSPHEGDSSSGSSSGSESGDSDSSDDDLGEPQEPIQPSSDGRTVEFELSTLNNHLVCLLCNGYFRDAHTIMECLHTFCKICLSVYLDAKLDAGHENAADCPRCGIHLSSADPMQNMVRMDRTMQNLVDKILPEFSEKEASLKAKCDTSVTSTPLSSKSLSSPSTPSVAPPFTVLELDGKKDAESKGLEKAEAEMIIVEISPHVSAAAKDPETSPVTLETSSMVGESGFQKCVLRTSSKTTVRAMKKIILAIKTGGVNIHPSQMSLFCKSESLGNEHSLEFIQKTRWHDPRKHLALTFDLKA